VLTKEGSDGKASGRYTTRAAPDFSLSLSLGNSLNNRNGQGSHSKCEATGVIQQMENIMGMKGSKWIVKFVRIGKQLNGRGLWMSLDMLWLEV
jgi:hypothetical protein